jgi:hypothetical protein
MFCELRLVADGARFKLLRTGEWFKLVRRDFNKNRMRIIVKSDHRIEGTLNHQCLVQVDVKPKIKLKGLE